MAKKNGNAVENVLKVLLTCDLSCRWHHWPLSHFGLQEKFLRWLQQPIFYLGQVLPTNIVLTSN